MARKLSINEQPPAPAMTNKNFGFFVCCCAKPRFAVSNDASPDAPPAAQIERLLINCRLLSLMEILASGSVEERLHRRQHRVAGEDRPIPRRVRFIRRCELGVELFHVR